jgi:hypothetical protein
MMKIWERRGMPSRLLEDAGTLVVPAITTAAAITTARRASPNLVAHGFFSALPGPEHRTGHMEHLLRFLHDEL